MSAPARAARSPQPRLAYDTYRKIYRNYFNNIQGFFHNRTKHAWASRFGLTRMVSIEEANDGQSDEN
jgi:hypothetical protein